MTISADLSQPLYGATISQAVRRFFAKYATFSGRASRSEFWWMWLVLIILNGIFTGIYLAVGGSLATMGQEMHLTPASIVVLVIWGLVALALLIPTIALTVRRLHDGNFSGWLYLLHLVPYLGSLVVFILTLLPSKPAGARFDK